MSSDAEKLEQAKRIIRRLKEQRSALRRALCPWCRWPWKPKEEA